MPHAALWVVQQNLSKEAHKISPVSMPHAALWVVQRKMSLLLSPRLSCFNAARGFVGGAALDLQRDSETDSSFNAARGFVGGAASSLSALVPLRGKRPFGKSPEI